MHDCLSDVKSNRHPAHALLLKYKLTVVMAMVMAGERD
jgi:hypothetical protein